MTTISFHNRLVKGDTIICIMKDIEDLTYGKEYEITYTRLSGHEDDICIKDDLNHNWWFGQVGVSESWESWFVTKKQWERDEKLYILLNK